MALLVRGISSVFIAPIQNTLNTMCNKRGIIARYRAVKNTLVMVCNKRKMIARFREVKSMGYIPSHRTSDTGIGKTFEDCVGVAENNINAPDLFGFEIKAHRENSSSYVTLFTRRPSFPDDANSVLNAKFGTPYPNNPNLKRLHTSMFATQSNTYMGKYSFQLCIDHEAKKILIQVSDLQSGNILDKSVGYTFEEIEETLKNKLENLFYVSAKRQKSGGTELFLFHKADVYMRPSIERFINLLQEGKIMYDIRIGSYKSGANYGKAHDHGSGFRILPQSLDKLFAYHEEVE